MPSCLQGEAWTTYITRVAGNLDAANSELTAKEKSCLDMVSGNPQVGGPIENCVPGADQRHQDLAAVYFDGLMLIAENQ
jgi:hypothetical protein